MRARILLFVGAIVLAGAASADPPAMPPPDPIFASGDFAAAEQHYAATLAQTPNDAAALAGLARIRLYQERRDEARKLANQALAVDPANPLAKRVMAGATLRDAAFAPDVYKIDMPKGGTRIAFETTDPLPVVKVRIAGRDVYFLIDTGGPDLVLDTAFAAELGLQTSAAGQGTFAGGQQAAVMRAVLPEVQFGAATVRAIPIAVLATRVMSPKPDLRIDGVVGTGFLMHFLSTLDYVHGALILRPRSDSAAFERSAKGAVPMWLVGDHFLFARGRIGTAPEGLFNIDTGLEGAGLQATRATLDAAGITPDPSKVQSGRGGGGMVRFITFKASASLGSLTEPDVDGVYTPDGDQFGLFPFTVAGTLSHGFFRAHSLTFDFVAMKIVVQ